MPKPHILQIASYPAPDQTALDAAYTTHRLWLDPDLTQIGPQIQAIATNGGAGVASDVIRACPNLKLIAIYGVGYDAIDLALCAERHIQITNTPDVLTGDCADLALGMMLSLARQIPAADHHARSGAWTQTSFPLQRRVWGAKAGILGMGRIGQDVATRLQGFGIDIAYSARHEKPLPYKYIPDPIHLATHADFLFVTAAATPETHHIINAATLAALGPNGFLINISRAANVDESALLDALESHQIAGAALDVFDAEPHINPRFAALTNALLQPHHASATHETRRAMGQLMRDNLAAYFANRPLINPVT
ncbi:MAG: 2-hydroxyacid dehydrogenase [Cypionkella sp.]|uniref:2-hydroxyacid dehydrogenase n=1 Tax=Cypionkella sp. TaxID=2811411 RepID=UPI00263916D3|nr:2-hydroxyacid dehydrogenase [Cypionkella sp.]MDB5660160.1 2-hydroxyacid dehydrogenase [Cypionkella sp.]